MKAKFSKTAAKHSRYNVALSYMQQQLKIKVAIQQLKVHNAKIVAKNI